MEYREEYKQKTDWSEYTPIFTKDENGHPLVLMIKKKDKSKEVIPYYVET